VRRRRADGYHQLETVFAFCNDGDTIEAELAPQTRLTIDGPFAAGLSTTDNLVVKAAMLLGVTARLKLTKNVPVASGIGGGSADAAATLRLLCNLSGAQMPSIADQRSLGADVPACVASQTLRGSGVGDELAEADSVSGRPILLVNPRQPLSTAAVFARWDGVDRGALDNWRTGRNDLEPAALALVPAIADLLAWLRGQTGTTCVRMSGSGATCFALFETLAQRDAALLRGTAARPDWWFMGTTLR
jgi:4-diphosphocytidyl-2-C-methyl-D-erythritol kinase